MARSNQTMTLKEGASGRTVRSAENLLSDLMRPFASTSKAAICLLAGTVLYLLLSVRHKVMAVEAGIAILTLLSLGVLDADSIIVLPLKKPLAIVTVETSHSSTAVTSLEVVITGSIHLSSFFKGLNVVAVLASVTELAGSFIDVKDANSDFISSLLDIQVPFMLLQAFNVEGLVAVAY